MQPNTKKIFWLDKITSISVHLVGTRAEASKDGHRNHGFASAITVHGTRELGSIWSDRNSWEKNS
jgi:hypothetical protein